MKAKALVTIALFAASGYAAAGGLGIDNVDQHMNADNWVDTQANRATVNVQGPIDQFENYVAERALIVDVNRLKQNYDGQS